MSAILHVCITCRGNDTESSHTLRDENAPRPGSLLLAAIENGDVPNEIVVRPVECLSGCGNACCIALSSKGKWTYVYGHMTPLDAGEILTGAAAYSASSDGLVPWRERVQLFRKQCLARVPPQD